VGNTERHSADLLEAVVLRSEFEFESAEVVVELTKGPPPDDRDAARRGRARSLVDPGGGVVRERLPTVEGLNARRRAYGWVRYRRAGV
jgi:hypothetical protein